jgi:hypothetical protein
MIPTESRHPEAADLVLHAYGECAQVAAIDRHLALCPACALEFQAIVDTLAALPDTPVPERGDLYGLEVWQRIRPCLPVQESGWHLRWDGARVAAAAMLFASLIAVAFLAGRYAPVEPAPSAPAPPVIVDAGDARLTATADHLERSERILLDVTNASGSSIDMSRQQASAAGLVEANRLFREAAVQAGDTAVAALLDDLERTLLDIVHAPSTLTAAELEPLRTRLDAAALLFKVRILSNELREREDPPLASRKTT